MQVPRGVAYWLGNAVYVSVTNRARGLSLVASRGPAFRMPEASGFAPLEREPTVDEVAAAVDAAYADPRKRAVGVDVGRTRRADGGATDGGVAFAGLGDPLVRWEVVRDAAARVRASRPGAPIRVVTNGLAPDGADPGRVAAALAAAGVDSATVALNAATPDAYDALVLAPPRYAPAYHASAADAVGDVRGASFASACAMVTALAEAGVAVDVSRVSNASCSAAAVRALALSLGARETRDRPFFDDP